MKKIFLASALLLAACGEEIHNPNLIDFKNPALNNTNSNLVDQGADKFSITADSIFGVFSGDFSVGEKKLEDLKSFDGSYVSAIGLLIEKDQMTIQLRCTLEKTGDFSDVWAKIPVVINTDLKTITPQRGANMKVTAPGGSKPCNKSFVINIPEDYVMDGLKLHLNKQFGVQLQKKADHL